jgi:choline kinase
MLPRAIILAAGTSKRMGAVTSTLPKCLLPLGQTTILGLQLQTLKRAGITDITIVTGFCHEHIQQHCGPEYAYVLNKDFATTNSIYSLWLALQERRGSMLILNADVVFHPGILHALLASPYPDALTVSFQSGMGQEEMKVQVHDGKITDISKDIDPAGADGENVGVVKFSAHGAEQLFAVTDTLVRSGVVRAWAPRAFQQLCRSHPVYAVATEGLPWIEIDFPEDLERARQEIYPAICGDARLFA